MQKQTSQATCSKVGAGVIAMVALMAPAVARADLLTVSAQVDVGGSAGMGIGGDFQDDAFFAKSPHGVYGVKVNAEVLFIDAWVAHHQFTNGSRVTTWTQLGVGMDTELGKPSQGSFLIAGVGLGLGAGTGQQVELPLDNGEITDKGVFGTVRLGVGTHLTANLDLGVEVPVSAGYYFKSGNGTAVNDVSTHYQAAHAQVLGYLRFRFGKR